MNEEEAGGLCTRRQLEIGEQSARMYTLLDFDARAMQSKKTKL